MKEKNFSCCFVNTEDPPVKTEHIGWIAKYKGKNVALYEIVDCFYNHPEAVDLSLIQVIRILHTKTVNKNSEEAASILNMINAQNILNNEKRIENMKKE